MKKEKITKADLVGTLNELDCNVPATADKLKITRSGVYWLLGQYKKKIVKTKKLIDVKDIA